MKIVLHQEDIPKSIKIGKSVAIDTETTSLDPHQADLVGISMSTKIGKACYIPISHSSGNCLDKKKVIKLQITINLVLV